MFTNAVERARPLFMFVHLVNRAKYLFHVCSLTKQMNINDIPTKRLTNCSLNVSFVYSPTSDSV
ncbi:hypothetical protein Hanom_Chr09g00766941 [Helianthus anomalus]